MLLLGSLVLVDNRLQHRNPILLVVRLLLGHLLERTAVEGRVERRLPLDELGLLSHQAGALVRDDGHQGKVNVVVLVDHSSGLQLDPQPRHDDLAKVGRPVRAAVRVADGHGPVVDRVRLEAVEFVQAAVYRHVGDEVERLGRDGRRG